MIAGGGRLSGALNAMSRAAARRPLLTAVSTTCTKATLADLVRCPSPMAQIRAAAFCTCSRRCRPLPLLPRGPSADGSDCGCAHVSDSCAVAADARLLLRLLLPCSCCAASTAAAAAAAAAATAAATS